MVFNYLDHVVTPAWCPVTITCNSVSPSVAGVTCQNLSNGDSGEITWVFDDTKYNADSPPDTYTFTFDVSVNGLVSDQFTFDLTLTDPCTAANVANTVTKPVINTYVYVITDSTASDTENLSPKFSVGPSWCNTQLEFDAPGLENFATWDENAQTVAYTEITDNLFMAGVIDAQTNPNLEKTYPVTIKQTVTDYDGNKSTEEVVYNVIIRNPCIDQDYV